MKRIFLSLFVLLNLPLFAQEVQKETTVDSLYREDQFYVSITYNLLGKMPSDVAQNGFSSGFHFGFVRDMPINKNRTVAFGLGLGYSANSFNQNILITEVSKGNYSYSIVDNSQFSKNKFFQHIVEIPLEFRFRKSTATEHKFFRLHAGFKLGYVFASKYKYKGSLEAVKLIGIEDFNDIQSALTFSIGYDTWNFFFQYGLNPIFDYKATLDGKSIDMNAIKIGLIFYIL